MKNHNRLTSKDVLKYFMDMFRHYLNWNKIKDYELHLNSIWVNQMKEHEYNPVHTFIEACCLQVYLVL